MADPREKFSFASGANAAYVDALFEDYKNDPDSVEESWQQFFKGYEFGALKAPSTAGGTDAAGADEAKVEAFINAYRRLGHMSCELTPLREKPPIQEDMLPEHHGLGAVNNDKIFHPSNLRIAGGSGTFGEIYEFLRDTYCCKIGADYRDINNIDCVVWLQDKMEECKNKPSFDLSRKKRILNKLIETEGFERFLQDRFLGQKRFSIEGLDSMIPLLDTIADEAANLGANEIDIGMAHRGRLNVLANFMGKEHEALLQEFEGAEFNPMNIEGDVKYHKGFTNEIDTFSGKKMRVYLAPNPSHLEAVNPVLEGFVRARQRLQGDVEQSQIIPLLVHGDAAVVGQGIVSETLNLVNLDHYSTGGTIHIIANNQIGFTANPGESRSCTYASDVAKFIHAPVLHVNADDAEAVVWAAQLAVAYRQKFKNDFVIDLIGYRRHGHNETDEPAFTQPLMYEVVKKHPTVFNVYAKQLAEEGVLSETESKQLYKDFRAGLQAGLNQVRAKKFVSKAKVPEAFKNSLKYVPSNKADMEAVLHTGITEDRLQQLAKDILNFPDSFKAHPKISKLFETRKQMMTKGGAIDWGMAELLAYAVTASEGVHIRLSGQDTGRGTFSHRQAVLRDFEANEPYNIFETVKEGKVHVINSPLSEAACLGFEFGYSIADSDALILWEAQFGDFANGAQIIMDQFLVASEAKWKQASSIVLLLPHGYEGQGPEHSNARPERFLQACGNLNIQLVNVTTPAQFFHVIRRQVVRDFQKPLVVMTPKSLLRHPKVISTVEDICRGSFSPVIDDVEVTKRDQVERIILCSGKIYYDLLAEREKNTEASGQIPIVRVEQAYPFPLNELTAVLKAYPNAKEIVWTQEEPINMGCWMFMRARLESLATKKQSVIYIGRKGAGSTAEGSLKSHTVEQQRIVSNALGLSCSMKDSSEKA